MRLPILLSSTQQILSRTICSLKARCKNVAQDLPTYSFPKSFFWLELQPSLRQCRLCIVDIGITKVVGKPRYYTHCRYFIQNHYPCCCPTDSTKAEDQPTLRVKFLTYARLFSTANQYMSNRLTKSIAVRQLRFYK